MVLGAILPACEDEKDLIIIEGNLPIKTKALYMVGSATPNGWNIDNPTAFTPTEEDALVFTWEGNLLPGEMKLCLTTGSWDAPFIRPRVAGEEISRNAITKAAFQMHAGDPDEKWNVKEAGVYRLTFDLRNWNMSTEYLKEPDAPKNEPISTETFYIVGDATPNGWDINNPVELKKTAPFVFEYDGALNAGDFKACCAKGSWDVPFVRPAVEGVTITTTGVSAPEFVFVANPDNKWKVAEAGMYHLTFDLQSYTVKAEYKGQIKNEKEPISTATFYIIGDATPGGWSMDAATACTKAADYKFTLAVELVEGSFKAMVKPDNTFSCPFFRPAAAGVTVGENGASLADCVYTRNPDDQWRVTKAGRYELTFDLEKYTMAAKYLGASKPVDPDQPQPLVETNTLFMIGDATPNGWSMDDLTPMVQDKDNKYVFTWEGQLKDGAMKMCIAKDGTWSCPFVRPTAADVVIDAKGVASADIVYTKDPDNKWKVSAGRYAITVNLMKKNIEVKAVPAPSQKRRK